MNTLTPTPQSYVSSAEFLRQHKGLVSRTLFYSAVKRGELPHVRVGRRILVPTNALDLLLVGPCAVPDSEPGRSVSTDPDDPATTNPDDV